MLNNPHTHTQNIIEDEEEEEKKKLAIIICQRWCTTVHGENGEWI